MNATKKCLLQNILDYFLSFSYVAEFPISNIWIQSMNTVKTAFK